MNNAYVTAGVPMATGAVYRAVLGTTLPTNAYTPLSSAYKDMGYISQDGITNSNSPESSDIKAWGGDTVLTLQTGKPDTFQLTLLEARNEDVLKAVYGSANVSGSLAAGLTVSANAKEPEEAVWVIDMNEHGGAFHRIVIPDGKISALGDISYKDSDAVGYQITITAMPDSSGNTHYDYRLTPGVTLNKSTESVAVGSTKSLTATTTPSGGTVTWETSDATVATVNNGTVSGVAAGTAVISAIYAGKVATCTVTVTGT